MGMKANSKSEVPDPVIIYNYSLIEGEAAGSEEDILLQACLQPKDWIGIADWVIFWFCDVF